MAEREEVLVAFDGLDALRRGDCASACWTKRPSTLLQVNADRLMEAERRRPRARRARSRKGLDEALERADELDERHGSRRVPETADGREGQRHTGSRSGTT